MIRFAAFTRILGCLLTAILAAVLYICASPPIQAADPPAKPTAPGEKPAEAAEKKPVSYHTDILPILQANCQGCHQPAKASGKLDMTVFKSMLAAGESGTPAIVPGKPAESCIIEQITPDKGEAAMPKDKPPLAASQIDLIRRWIEEGAKDDTPPDSAPQVDAEHPPVYNGPPVITSLDWSPNGELLAIAGFHEVLLLKADDVVRGSPDPAQGLTEGLRGTGDLRSDGSAGQETRAQRG